MIDTLHIAVAVRTIGTGGNFTNAKRLVDSTRNLQETLGGLILNLAAQELLKGDIPADEDAGSALASNVGNHGITHFNAAAEPVNT